ncbi:MAG: glycosyltransferase family 39 protein [Actinomycetes bacterium]
MPRPYFAALLGILAAAFTFRIWGISHGLPYAYNMDESNYYVTRAIRMVDGGLNPHWFVNPPGFTYLLALGFKVLSGGGRGFAEVYARNPEPVWILARTISALLGTLAVGLVYATGAKLFDRRAGLFAAGALAVGFLPVFYGHLALNDSALLVPMTLALFGAAGILNGGGRRDYLIAGVGLGLTCGIKYTGGVVLVAIICAAWQDKEWRARGLSTVVGVAALMFVIINPYSLLDFAAFSRDLGRQSEASSGPGKLGQTGTGGVLYYLGVQLWGLGWGPALLSVFGAVQLSREDFRRARVLLLAPAAYVLFMGLHTRWFGRWGLPIMPFTCLLAGWAASRLVGRAQNHSRQVGIAVTTLLVALVGLQGVMASIHLDTVLSQPDTRASARTWMLDNIPKGSKVVIEPGVVPQAWTRDLSRAQVGIKGTPRWGTWPSSQWHIDSADKYPGVLHRALLKNYTALGWCWVVTSSLQRGRVEREPTKAPGGISFYRSLFAHGTLAYKVTPWSPRSTDLPFSFDDSYNYRPSAYIRPGPVVSVYRLHGGKCGPVN